MNRYRIEVRETLVREIEVEANNAEEAREIVEKMYSKEEIVLDYSDFAELNIAETISQQ